MPPFRFQGKTAFLTYAQAERIEGKQTLFEFLQGCGQPTKIIVAQELHQDGGVHYHAVLYWPTKRDIRDVRYFDFMGHHPNLAIVQDRKAVLRYVTKDGDFTNVGWALPNAEREDVFTAMMEEMEGGTDPTEVIRATIVRTGSAGLRMYSQVAGFVDRVMVPAKVYQPLRNWPLEFAVTEPGLTLALLQFVEDVSVGFGDRGTRKSLWLYGGSRMGKTDLARSLGVHWYMNGAWNVEGYSDAATYGILDDIEWPSLQRYYKGLLGLQKHVTVTDKYKPKKTIMGGKPVLVLSNALPVFTVEEALWLDVNVNFVRVNERVY